MKRKAVTQTQIGERPMKRPRAGSPVFGRVAASATAVLSDALTVQTGKGFRIVGRPDSSAALLRAAAPAIDRVVGSDLQPPEDDGALVTTRDDASTGDRRVSTRSAVVQGSDISRQARRVAERAVRYECDEATGMLAPLQQTATTTTHVDAGTCLGVMAAIRLSADELDAVLAGVAPEKAVANVSCPVRWHEAMAAKLWTFEAPWFGESGIAVTAVPGVCDAVSNGYYLDGSLLAANMTADADAANAQLAWMVVLAMRDGDLVGYVVGTVHATRDVEAGRAVTVLYSKETMQQTTKTIDAIEVRGTRSLAGAVFVDQCNDCALQEILWTLKPSE
jgi:hypothetical protein